MLMKPIYVLGDGQLGNMLLEAGARLGLSVVPMSIDQATDIPAQAIITAEREHWSASAFISSTLSHQGWLNAKTFVEIPDRRRQKALLDELGLPTSPWCVTSADTQLGQLQERLGSKFLLKSARDGYDGKGQWRFTGQADAHLPEWKQAAIAEQFIDFETEVSIVGARSPSGQFAFYELTENFHDDGILQLSIKTEGGFAKYQAQAEDYLSRLMESLDYVGVMAIEFFVTKEGLLINEIAPRVHNSGHWTQAGASISQFELHLRAISDLPLPTIAQSGCSLMVNLIGAAFDPRWYLSTGARIHWYGKEVRPGRKLGHLNFHHQEPRQIAQWLQQLPLDERYQTNRDKVIARLELE
ncbi:MAG: 5-(carboxyamino)imidazole ribonucleotide synthase [Pseudohongiellaceae bacterium]|jgi:5-(carboxyamino)imidazole ribonucleotide synthase